MNKKVRTKLIRDVARKIIKDFKTEIEEWTDEEMEFKFKGGIEGVKYLLAELKENGLIY